MYCALCASHSDSQYTKHIGLFAIIHVSIFLVYYYLIVLSRNPVPLPEAFRTDFQALCRTTVPKMRRRACTFHFVRRLVFEFRKKCCLLSFSWFHLTLKIDRYTHTNTCTCSTYTYLQEFSFDCILIQSI
jgi:hypothetical protein